MHFNANDLTGKRFGRLVAIEPENRRNAKGASLLFWVCQCDCGKTLSVRGVCLTKRNSPQQSCGCLARELAAVRMTTHGHSHSAGNTRAYRAWTAMLRRCNNPNVVQYKWYGGRGIQVCEAWLRFETFLADMGEPPNGMTLDRRDANGNYERDNCRWATQADQCRNRRCNKLDAEKAAAIRASSERTSVLMRRYGVSDTTILNVRAGRIWAPR